MQAHGYEFDIGLSFAGEQRKYVELVAEELDYRGIRVYYDAYDQANLWGRDLGEYFREVFQEKCRFCMVFASKEYATKMWPTFELENALKKATNSRRDFILPVRFDETIIPGIPYTLGYLDAHSHTPIQISQLAAQRLGVSEVPARIEFAFLCTGIELTPRLKVELPGFNKQHHSQGPLLTLIKVVFSRGERAVADLEVRVTDSNDQVVGSFSGRFTANGICSTFDPAELQPLESETAYVNGVLITDTIQLREPGTYRIAWYLNGSLQRTSSMLVYLPEDQSVTMTPCLTTTLSKLCWTGWRAWARERRTAWPQAK